MGINCFESYPQDAGALRTPGGVPQKKIAPATLKCPSQGQQFGLQGMIPGGNKDQLIDVKVGTHAMIDCWSVDD